MINRLFYRKNMRLEYFDGAFLTDKKGADDNEYCVGITIYNKNKFPVKIKNCGFEFDDKTRVHLLLSVNGDTIPANGDSTFAVDMDFEGIQRIRKLYYKPRFGRTSFKEYNLKKQMARILVDDAKKFHNGCSKKLIKEATEKASLWFDEYVRSGNYEKDTKDGELYQLKREEFLKSIDAKNTKTISELVDEFNKISDEIYGTPLTKKNDLVKK